MYPARNEHRAFVSKIFRVQDLRGWRGIAERQVCVKRRRPIEPQNPKAVLEIPPQEKNDVNGEHHAEVQDAVSPKAPLSFDVDAQSNDESKGEEWGSEDEWYTIVSRISKNDEAASLSFTSNEGEDGVLDLGAVDDNSRKLLTRNCYAGVVDVDIEEGGVLAEDEDNNDMFCGVGLEALVETEELVENLQKNFGITTATHVQLAAIPRVTDGKDIVIQSHTGSGKTLAFLLPVLDEMEVDMDVVQVAIVAPTRELAMQISRECDRLIEGTDVRNLALIGGANPARQVEKLRKQQPHIVVGTPGRLAELHASRDLNLKNVQTLVVDEVDQCLQEVFLKHITYLLKAVGRAQKVLVSATGDVDSVRNFAVSNLFEPVLLRVGGSQRIPKTIYHWHYLVPARLRIDALRKLMYSEPVPQRAIVFVDDPRRVDIVVQRLHQMKLAAGALRGNAHKLERAEVLTAFRKGRVNMLVTTEVAARGLDVREITHVINLDMPTDGDHYLHRAGRCGRIGGEGHVISITTADKAFVVTRLARELGIDITRMEPRGGAYREPLDRSNDVKYKKTVDNETQNPAIGSTRPRNNSAQAKRIASGVGMPKKRKVKEELRKTEAKERVKAKLKEKKKAVERAASKKKARKMESGSEAEQAPRQRFTVSERAKREGWVGNR
eukprot:TRINITY_DN2870_c0_g1_i1.p1 TRINITY_DN2870_c0_g1~~TRINITY_DN2870_c0_g1_i1.p1  ORF type:complete len:665 (-),score=119.37 TRINITY_DN2870_c0_g1_i1:5817-7811(-)